MGILSTVRLAPWFIFPVIIMTQPLCCQVGTWQIGNVYPNQNETLTSAPGGLYFQFNGALPISVSDNDFSVYSWRTGHIQGTFSAQGMGSFTHSFIPTASFSLNDTIYVKISGDIRDASGSFLDGNKNGSAEGSPDDDFTYSFVIRDITGILSPPQPASMSVTVFPTPVQNLMTVKLHIQNTSNVQIRLFSLTGQEIASVYQGTLSQGSHSISWSKTGNAILPGVYFLAVQTASSRHVTKIIFE